MKKFVLALCTLLVCFSAWGQPRKTWLKAVRQAAAGKAAASSSAVQAARRTGERVSASVRVASEKAARSAAVLAARAQSARCAEVEKNIGQSLFHIVSPHDGTTWGSGFVIERNGKLWGVASYHVTGRAGNVMWLRFYRADGSAAEYRARVVMAGSYGFNGADASLLELPSEVRLHAVALKVAPEGPQKNTLGDSFGFPDENFRPSSFSKAAGRRIVDVTGYKIITTQPPLGGAGNGSCGGPLLNRNGEVVGIHSGSFQSKLSFAANAKLALDDLFYALEHGGRAERELTFNGVKMLDINVTESVGLVLVRRGTEEIFSRDFLKYPGSFDYAHMERVIPARPGDRITLYLKRGRQEVRLEFFTVPRSGAGFTAR